MTTKTQAQLSASQQSDTMVSTTGVLQCSLENTPELEQDSLQSRITNSTDFQDSAFRENFSRVPVGRGSMLLVQAKLLVGQPNDKYEQEADRVAEQVMRMPGTAGLGLHTQAPNIQHYKPQLNHPLQRQLFESEAIAPEQEEEEEEKKLQAKELSSPPLIRHYLGETNGKVQRQSVENEEEEEEETSVQTKSNVSGQTTVKPTVETQLSSSQGVGHSLPKSTRTFMESRFSHDFMKVQVHTDSPAVQMNRDLNAQAFTHGHHIYFGQGQYQPQTRTGKQLLAHELTHVVQQTGGRTIQPKSLVQLRSHPTLLQRRQAPEPSPTPLPTADETIESEPTPAEDEVLSEIEAGAEAEAETESVASPEETEALATPPAETGESAPVSESIELLTPDPPAGLSSRERSRLSEVQDRVGETAEAESMLPPAEANVAGAQATVAEPQEEADAKAEGQVVSTLSKETEPVPTIESICKRVEQIINDQTPDDEEEIARFNPEAAADSGRDELNQSVERDAENIQGNYNRLDELQEGSPKPPQAEAIEVPPETVESPEIDATAAVPEPVELNLDEDVAASSERITQAGMDTEPARLAAEGAPNGPIATALTTQTELETSVQQDVPTVLAEQQTILGTARADMAATERVGKADLNASRTGTIGGVFNQQTAMVSAEEQMRIDLSTRGKQIVEAARQQVNTLLGPLPQEALRRWEEGKSALVDRFDRDLSNVNRWIEENKDDLLGGIIRFFTGLPSWIERDISIAKRNFVTGVCQLLRDISDYVDSVIAESEKIIDDADQEHKALFEQDLPEELREWAAAEREKFSGQLDGLRKQVTDTKANITRKLAAEAEAAATEARDRINELRSQARGWLGQIVDAIAEFASDVARFIIDGLLNLVGIEPASFWALVDKIGQAIDDIADDPLGFAENLLSAIGQGFQQFFDRFAEHMLDGLLDWLFSGLGSVGVEIPTDFSLKSIITFFLQLMGISWERIRRLLAKHIGEENVALIEKAYEIIANLIEMGPEGIFELIFDHLNPQTILDQILQAAVDFMVEALIKAVSARVILLFNPVGAIAQAIEAIYRVLKWIFENAARIFSLIETVVNGITKIIAGDIGGMANAVEGALAQLIAPVVDFLAGYLGFGDLPDKIADTIRGFQEWIEGILDRVIGFLAERARALLRSLGLGEEESQVVESDGEQTLERPVRFTGQEHRLRAQIEDDQTNILMASNGFKDLDTQIGQLRDNYLQRVFSDTNQPEAHQELQDKFRNILRRKAEILRQANAPQNRDNRTQILGDGLDELDDLVAELSDYLVETYGDVLGPGTQAELQSIIYVVQEDRGFIVIDVRVIDEGHVGIRARSLDRTQEKFLSYASYGSEWRIPSQQEPPPYAGFSGSQGTGTRRGVNIQDGDLGGQDPRVEPPGYDSSGKWNRRGHLVANRFGGPGDHRNIVAMTFKANQTNEGMREIENDVLRDIKKGAVFVYKATPIYNGASYLQSPPKKVRVVADEVWPNTDAGKHSKDVDNT